MGVSENTGACVCVCVGVSLRVNSFMNFALQVFHCLSALPFYSTPTAEYVCVARAFVCLCVYARNSNLI